MLDKHFVFLVWTLGKVWTFGEMAPERLPVPHRRVAVSTFPPQRVTFSATALPAASRATTT